MFCDKRWRAFKILRDWYAPHLINWMKVVDIDIKRISQSQWSLIRLGLIDSQSLWWKVALWSERVRRGKMSRNKSKPEINCYCGGKAGWNNISFLNERFKHFIMMSQILIHKKCLCSVFNNEQFCVLYLGAEQLSSWPSLNEKKL